MATFPVPPPSSMPDITRLFPVHSDVISPVSISSGKYRHPHSARSRRLNYNPFLLALKGNTNKLKSCIDSGGLDLDSRDNAGYSLLVYALHCVYPRRRYRTVRLLLHQDIDCLTPDNITGRDGLLWATHKNLEREALCILEGQYGCVDLHQCDVYGYSALHYAVYHQHLHLISAACRYARKFAISVDVAAGAGGPHGADEVTGVEGAGRAALTPYLLAKRLAHHSCSRILVKVGGVCEHQHDLLPCGNYTSLLLNGLNSNSDWNKREHRFIDEELPSCSSRGSARSADSALSTRSSASPTRLSLHMPVSYAINRPTVLNTRHIASSQQTQDKQDAQYTRFKTFEAEIDKDGENSRKQNRKNVAMNNTEQQDGFMESEAAQKSNDDTAERPNKHHRRSRDISNTAMLSKMWCILSDECNPAYAPPAPPPDPEILNSTGYPWPHLQKTKQISKRNEGKFACYAKRVSNLAYVMRRCSATSRSDNGSKSELTTPGASQAGGEMSRAPSEKAYDSRRRSTLRKGAGIASLVSQLQKNASSGDAK